MLKKFYENQLIIFLFFNTFSYFSVKFFELDILESEVFDSYFQVLDLTILFSDPLKSIIHQHTQPPLFNILIFLLHIIGGSLYENFIIMNVLSVSTISIIIFKILYEISNKFKFAFIISFCFLIFPSTILYTTYSFYPCITALGYTILIYSFHISEKQKLNSLILFSFSLIFLTLIRSSFSFLHLFFYVFIYLIYTWGNKKTLKTYFGLFFIIILCLFVPIKNYLLYDFFGSSSWGPINVAYGVGIQRDGGYWLTPEELKIKYPDIKCKKSYHAQDKNLTKMNGFPNFNSCLYIEYAKIISDEKMSGYKFLTHAKYFVSNSIRYFSPSDKYRVLSLSREKIRSYSDFVNYIQITIPLIKDYEISFLKIILLIMSLIISVLERNKFLGICFITISSHWITHAVTDGYESARFVYDIEFTFFLILGFVINYLFSRNKIKSDI